MDKKPLYNKKRTKFDPNEIIIGDQVCVMKLYNSKNVEIAETVFDKEDFEKIKQYKWYLCQTGYATNFKTRKRIHQLLMECPKGMEVDHKDGNKLNNKRENLRPATKSQQGQNRGPSKANKLGLRGVWKIRNGKYTSQIGLMGKKFFLGSFPSAEQAALAYNEKAKELFGEFAKLNVILRGR